jgi:Ser/Thr protein kinase RdoA (MazF antagonist)
LFVYDFIQVERPFEAVCERALRDGGRWLGIPAVRAYHDGEQLRLRVGPHGIEHLVGKEVVVELGTPRRSGEVLVIPMRWRATHAPALFPELDGELTIAPLHAAGTHLAMRGNYEPPLGWVGEQIDRLLFHRIAEATVRSFLHRVAAAIEEGPSEGPEEG